MTEEKAKYLRESLKNIQYEQDAVFKLTESVLDDLQKCMSGLNVSIRGTVRCVGLLSSVVNDLIEEGE